MNKIMLTRPVMVAFLASTMLAVTTCTTSTSVPTETAALAQCSDVLTGCKNPQFIGKSGNCSCFSCESPDKDHLTSICTSDPKDKLTLFEEEASSRKSAVTFEKFQSQVRERLNDLNIKDTHAIYKDDKVPYAPAQEAGGRPDNFNRVQQPTYNGNKPLSNTHNGMENKPEP